MTREDQAVVNLIRRAEDILTSCNHQPERDCACKRKLDTAVRRAKRFWNVPNGDYLP